MGTLPDGSAVRFTLLDAYPPPPQMNNKEGQTPCLMASYLYTPCYGTNGTSQPLNCHSDPHMPTIFTLRQAPILLLSSPGLCTPELPRLQQERIVCVAR